MRRSVRPRSRPRRCRDLRGVHTRLDAATNGSVAPVYAQRSDDGARRRCSGMLTLAEQLGQHPFHLLECCDFLADVCESVACYLADGAATSPLFEPHEFANLIETEAKVLRALDEPNPINRGSRVAPHAAGAVWDSQQTTS